MDEIERTRNYFRNVDTSGDRTLRIELVGNILPEERRFLEGCAFFMAGTLSKDDERYTAYVSGEMAKLVRRIMRRLKKGMEG